MERVLFLTLFVAVVATMPLQVDDSVALLDESYTDAETANGLPELDEAQGKSLEAAALTKKAGQALKQAESTAAVARSIKEAMMVAKAKVKSAAALVAVAQKNYDDGEQRLQESEKAAADAKATKEQLETEWDHAKKHESSTVVVSAKAMKTESESKEELTKLEAQVALTGREFARAQKEDRLARHAYQIAAKKSADSARKSAELAEDAHQALAHAEGDEDAVSDGSQEAAATKSAMATREGETASNLAHEAASVGKFASDAAQKLATVHEAKEAAAKAFAAAQEQHNGLYHKVQTTIKVAVEAKRSFEKVDDELNGKEGEIGDEHLKAMALAESRAIVEAAMHALTNAKIELKVASDKFSKMDVRSQEAASEAEARKAAARTASKAASLASEAAAQMAAKLADSAAIQVTAPEPSDEATAEEAPTGVAQKTTTEVTLGDSAAIDQSSANAVEFGLDPV
jgi:hypothetical protein